MASEGGKERKRKEIEKKDTKKERKEAFAVSFVKIV